MPEYLHGWFQLGYEAELPGPLATVSIGTRRLLIVRRKQSLRAFDASCPHRGANLAVGGRLDQDAIICPFHGYRIGLGCPADGDGFAVKEYPLYVVRGLVFVRLSDAFDCAFPSTLDDLAANHRFVPALTLAIAARPELVIENGVDQRHFTSVHGIATGGFALSDGAGEALAVDSTFTIPVMPRDRDRLGGHSQGVSYQAVYFSPGIVLVRLGGISPYAALTSVTDHRGDGACTLRLTLIVPNDTDDQMITILQRHSIRGIEDDRRIWESVVAPDRPRMTASDAPVVAFQHFCEQFR